MYYHVKISLNYKPTLYDAIWECFNEANIVVFKIAMSIFDVKSNTSSNTESDAKSIGDKVLLTVQQIQRLRENPMEW